MSSQATSDFRRRRKENLIKICGGKCNICGYSRSKSALEFHHINPEEKEYGISSKGTCHNFDKDIAEVKKCILLCSNCHREVHDGFYTREYLEEKKIFDEKIVEELKNPKQKKYYCISCKKEIQKNKTGLCQSCLRLKNIVNINREELKDLIRKQSFLAIGKKFNVSDNTIRNWCIKYNLPSKRMDIEKYSDLEWEKI